MPQPSMPPRLQWPTKKWPEGGWVAGTAAALLAGVAFIWTGAAQADLGVRIGLVLLSIAVPLALWQSWPRGSVFIRRIRQYDALHDCVEYAMRELEAAQSARTAADDQVQNLKVSLEAATRRSEDDEVLIQSLLQTLREVERNTLPVLDITWRRGHAMLVIGDRDPPKLSLGVKITVADSKSFRRLGHFEVTDKGPQGWLAMYTGQLDPTWWGFLSDQAENGVHPSLDLTAYLLPDDGRRP